MGSDWTGGPAKWAAVGALGCASVFGLAWSVANHGATPAGGPRGSVIAPAEPQRPVAPEVETPAPAAPVAAGPTAGALKPVPAGARPTRTINLNTATRAELELLPGIGPALAGRILEERGRLGRFGSVEQLDDVKGIGPKLMEKLRPLVRVE